VHTLVEHRYTIGFIAAVLALIAKSEYCSTIPTVLKEGNANDSAQ
jgi:hypothetical protein